MAERTKAQQTADELTSAYDERTRLFNALRDPRRTDEELKKLQTEYAEASHKFEQLRTAFTRK